MFLLEWARIFCSNIGIAVIKKPLLRNLKFVIPFAFDIQHWVAHLKSPGIHHLLDAFTTALSTTLLQINKKKFGRCLVVFRQPGRKTFLLRTKNKVQPRPQRGLQWWTKFLATLVSLHELSVF